MGEMMRRLGTLFLLLLLLFYRPSSPCSPPSGYSVSGASGQHFYRFYSGNYKFDDAIDHCQVPNKVTFVQKKSIFV